MQKIDILEVMSEIECASSIDSLWVDDVIRGYKRKNDNFNESESVSIFNLKVANEQENLENKKKTLDNIVHALKEIAKLVKFNNNELTLPTNEILKDYKKNNLENYKLIIIDGVALFFKVSKSDILNLEVIYSEEESKHIYDLEEAGKYDEVEAFVEKKTQEKIKEQEEINKKNRYYKISIVNFN